ncbi:MAG: hypothetical protein Q8R00_02455, partial [Candidatus Nanoarchaeia archaeon]|nr:hypothetical protein [Candidatus Nanoarchaeia archaeon]
MLKRGKLCINLVLTLIILAILPSVSAIIYTPYLNYNSSEINYTSSYSIIEKENITYYNITLKREYVLTAAMLTNNNDRFDKYQYLDSETKNLEDDEILNLSFNGTIISGNIISFKLENDKTSNIKICNPSVTCTTAYGSTATTTQGFYSMVLNLTNSSSYFSFHTTNKIDINHINATYFVNNTLSNTTYYYLSKAEITTENIQPIDLGSWSSISINETLNNQSIMYQYSTNNGSSWTNLTGTDLSSITSNQLRFKISLYSDGTETPKLNNFQVVYTQPTTSSGSPNQQVKNSPTPKQILERTIRSLPALASINPAPFTPQNPPSSNPEPQPAPSPLTGAVTTFPRSPSGKSIFEDISI